MSHDIIKAASVANGQTAALPTNYDTKDPKMSMSGGLTKREAIAMHCLGGLLGELNAEAQINLPKRAVEYADTLLLELAETT